MLNNVSNENRINSTSKALVFGAILFLFLVPYLLVSFYANPSGDNFANLASTLKQPATNWITKSAMQTRATYYSWQGTYFGSMITYLFSSVFHYGGVLGVHVESVLVIVLFVISLISLLNAFFKTYAVRDSRNVFWITLLSTLVLLFCTLYNFNVSEIFYWHTGFCIYTVPFSLALVSLGFSMSARANIPRVIRLALRAQLFCNA